MSSPYLEGGLLFRPRTIVTTVPKRVRRQVNSQNYGVDGSVVFLWLVRVTHKIPHAMTRGLFCVAIFHSVFAIRPRRLGPLLIGRTHSHIFHRKIYPNHVTVLEADPNLG